MSAYDEDAPTAWLTHPVAHEDMGFRIPTHEWPFKTGPLTEPNTAERRMEIAFKRRDWDRTLEYAATEMYMTLLAIKDKPSEVKDLLDRIAKRMP